MTTRGRVIAFRAIGRLARSDEDALRGLSIDTREALEVALATELDIALAPPSTGGRPRKAAPE